MKKFFCVFKISLKESAQYISKILFEFITFGLMIFILLSLWQHIYSGQGSISGYTINGVMWYVLAAEVIWFGTTNRSLSDEISYDIKSGKIAYNLNKPYNYIVYSIAKSFGEITIRFFAFLIVALIGGITFIGPIQGFRISNIIPIILVFLLGITINMLNRLTIGLVSFWVEENRPFHWIYDKIILTLGAVFPIEMLPLWLQPIIRVSPVFVVTYGPSRLLVNFSSQLFFQVVFMQVLYIVLNIGLLNLMYSKGMKKLNVNGG